MRTRNATFGWILLAFAGACAAQAIPGSTWRYYRPSNTGIQGDLNEAIYIGADGDPWIGGYDPGFEEGGVAKLVVSENRWINVSNVDYPVIGHPDLTGTTRVADIVADADGRLWMATWRGALRMDPAIGGASLVNYASDSGALLNGNARDLDIAPDGSVWFALVGFGGAQGGILRHTPSSGTWTFWTGGSVPEGGDNWPQEVFSVNHVSIQPDGTGGYRVWGESENSTSMVSFDSATQLWTLHPFEFTAGSLAALPGKDATDESGNTWMLRFARFGDGGSLVYSLDYRTAAGDWITPAQPPPSIASPAIEAFRAYGDRRALLIDGDSHVRQFDGSAWQDLGVWREGSINRDVDIDNAGNVWASGAGGAARRDAATGAWQRYRITNTSQYDFFNRDLDIDAASGAVLACANAGSGVGGMTRFDGARWSGFNNSVYGLGVAWPFPSDNCDQLAQAPLRGAVVVNPTYLGLHAWNGATWSDLQAPRGDSKGIVEDSIGRLWSWSPAGQLDYLAGSTWAEVASTAALGNNLERDPERPGTIWASGWGEVIRTDGVYRFSRDNTQFPELDPQSDGFTTVIPVAGGVAWLGSTRGMFRLDAESGTYDYFTSLGGISAEFATPLAATPDGRLWYSISDPVGTGPNGLVWYDGLHAGIYAAPRHGEPQWGGLPHAQINALRVKTAVGGYELWMACASRGIAVLFVPTDKIFGDGFDAPFQR
jgi:hypothetical protein